MTIALGERGVRGVVLDIEGTTTPISFVYDVLFPYARARLRDSLAAYHASPETREAVRLLHAEHEEDVRRGDAPPAIEARGSTNSLAPAEVASLVAYLESLMDRDRKSPGLKMLQGLIWSRGFGDGTLRGEVFPDVPPALERWYGAGLDVAIYSSGSVLAQRLLFGSTSHGDLTRYIGDFFDTAVGAKRSPESYARIARELDISPRNLLFVSDVADELEAARRAGMQTVLCIRPGNAERQTSEWETVRSLDEIER